MALSNLSMNEFTKMTDSERTDYVEGWLYIHSRKGK